MATATIQNTYGQGEKIGLVAVCNRNPAAWQVTETYTVGQYVSYNGLVYLALGTSTGAIPSTTTASWAVDSGLVDPDLVNFTLTPPGGTSVTYSLTFTDLVVTKFVKMSVGIYYIEINTSGYPGTWNGEFFGTGNGQCAQTWSAKVVAAKVSLTPNPTTMYMVMVSGEILGTGTGSSAALTVTQPPGATANRTFVGGIVLPANTTTTVGLTEIAGGANVETGWAECANYLAIATGKSFFAASAAVTSATQLGTRNKGTAPYNAMLALVTAANARTVANNQKLVVCALAEVGGDTDFGNGTNYKGFLIQYQIDFENDVKAITGQTQGVPVFVSQNGNAGGGTSDSSTGMVQAQGAAPGKVFLVSPKYQYTYYTNQSWLIGPSYRWMGACYAKAIYQVVFGAGTWGGTVPISTSRSSNLVTINYAVTTAPLVFDTTHVTDPGGAGTVKGFEWFDDSGTPVTVTAVSIQSPTQIVVTLSGVPTGSAGSHRIRYAHTAMNGAFAGPLTGPRGCVRDSGTETSSVGDPLWNWSARFSLTVPY